MDECLHRLPSFVVRYIREADPFRLVPKDRLLEPVERDLRGIRYSRELGLWIIFSPLRLADTPVVRRSAMPWGQHVTFQEYLAFDSLACAAAT